MQTILIRYSNKCETSNQPITFTFRPIVIHRSLHLNELIKHEFSKEYNLLFLGDSWGKGKVDDGGEKSSIFTSER